LSEFESSELPAFRNWRANFEPQPDAHAYLAQHLDVTTATLFCELLLPDLVLIRDCVLVAGRFEPSNFEEWWALPNANSETVERAINHLHLWDIFKPEGAVEERALHVLANRMARAWKIHAEEAFPGRVFSVDVTDEYGPTLVMSSAPRR